LIVAACHEGQLAQLYSEDFGPYPRIDGLEIINPFQS
jgi:predicted nucleic acid-binding protein